MNVMITYAGRWFGAKRSAIFVSAVVGILLLEAACAARQLENSKAIYEKARSAQESGHDLEAVAYWKKLVETATVEMEKGQFNSTNRFMRAAGRLELGMREEAFADLQELDTFSLRKEEYWIEPLYAVLMGDYYSQQGMYSIAEDFYRSVLRKSSLKSSSVYLITLERHVNNFIRRVEENSLQQPDPEKYRSKEYERLEKEIRKHVEDFPFNGVSHMLLADLLLKSGNADQALEHLLASLDLGLPGKDLLRSAEFQIATLLAGHQVPASLRKVLLDKAVVWWSLPNADHILEAGDESAAWLYLQSGLADVDQGEDVRVRYLGIRADGKLKVLIWERRMP